MGDFKLINILFKIDINNKYVQFQALLLIDIAKLGKSEREDGKLLKDVFSRG